MRYGPQSGISSSGKEQSFDEMECELDLMNRNELGLKLSDFNAPLATLK